MHWMNATWYNWLTCFKMLDLNPMIMPLNQGINYALNICFCYMVKKLLIYLKIHPNPSMCQAKTQVLVTDWHNVLLRLAGGYCQGSRSRDSI